MAKLKLASCVLFTFWYFAVVVFGLSELELGPNLEKNPNPVENTELSRVLERLEAQDTRIRELEKAGEECKSLKVSYEKSHEELKEEISSLKNKLDELKKELNEDDGLSLLRLPLRGPPGKQGEKGDQGLLAAQTLKSCSVAMEIFPSPRSKIQEIYPYGSSKGLEVLCDFETDGGGWTLIQKRSSGPQNDFDKNWNEYASGFGSLNKNFWLGLENIHALTKNGDQELRIELEDFEGNKRWAKYSNFSIKDASDFYRWTISGYSGNAGDDMSDSASYWTKPNGMRFSTKDKDNDRHAAENCAEKYSSGWWMDSCFNGNLNGLYREQGEGNPWAGGIHWYKWKGHSSSLAKTEMKIRTRKST